MYINTKATTLQILLSGNANWSSHFAKLVPSIKMEMYILNDLAILTG
jgi:hypothetical protein